MPDALKRASELCGAGRYREAGDTLRAALAGDPGNRGLLGALAEVQQEAGQTRDALETYNRLIALGNVDGPTWRAIGEALVRAGEYAQAVRAFEAGLSVAESAETRHCLGQALFKLGDIDAAVANLERAAEASGHLGSWLALATIIPGAPAATQKKILQVRQAFAKRLAASPQAVTPSRPGAAHRGAPIRVGYLSSWFASANYMKPVWSLINHHDRTRFEVHLFSDSPAGAVLEGYRTNPRDRRHDTGDLDNAGLAGLIADSRIDILVDLNGYSTPGRLGLFTAEPAPHCVGWFNMYATSGLAGHHYIVGDEHVVYPEDERFFVERVLRLPVSYLTFTTQHRAPPVVGPPCLRNGFVTFGSLAPQYKITPDVIAAWAEILEGVPDSRLFLANRALDSLENRRWLERRFAEHGVRHGRVQFAGSAPHYEYLRYYDRIDLALDTFPYNGGTTTMEAIWQGVPVLTFAGDRWASRTSRTLLCHTHLAGYARASRQDMVAAAIAIARDPATPKSQQALRGSMRARLERSSACDAGALARAMEDAFEEMMRRAAPR